MRVPKPVVLVASAAAPVALCVVVPRSRTRDVLTCTLQMWAYLAAYEMPHDDAEALQQRVHVDYPVKVDTVIGLGTPPTLRLQRLLSAPGKIRPIEKVLVWSHWLWFAVPHATTAYILLRRRERFGRAAVTTYARLRPRRARLLAACRPRRPGTPTSRADSTTPTTRACGG